MALAGFAVFVSYSSVLARRAIVRFGAGVRGTLVGPWSGALRPTIATTRFLAYAVLLSAAALLAFDWVQHLPSNTFSRGMKIETSAKIYPIGEAGYRDVTAYVVSGLIVAALAGVFGNASALVVLIRDSGRPLLDFTAVPAWTQKLELSLPYWFDRPLYNRNWPSPELLIPDEVSWYAELARRRQQDVAASGEVVTLTFAAWLGVTLGGSDLFPSVPLALSGLATGVVLRLFTAPRLDQRATAYRDHQRDNIVEPGRESRFAPNADERETGSPVNEPRRKKRWPSRHSRYLPFGGCLMAGVLASWCIGRAARVLRRSGDSDEGRARTARSAARRPAAPAEPAP